MTGERPLATPACWSRSLRPACCWGVSLEWAAEIGFALGLVLGFCALSGRASSVASATLTRWMRGMATSAERWGLNCKQKAGSGHDFYKAVRVFPVRRNFGG